MSMQIHYLKIWPEEYSAMKAGIKKFEYRKEDRGFKTGDILNLTCFDPKTAKLVNNCPQLMYIITYILKDKFGVQEGYCVMSLEELKPG